MAEYMCTDTGQDAMTPIEKAEAQLSRVLSFFPRVESRISGLFALNTAILTIIPLNIKTQDIYVWYICLPAIATILLVTISYYHIYKANFPDVKGGQGSIVYFNEIQKRTEQKYVDEFMSCSESDYTKDILGQVWRNSEILSAKYSCIKQSIRFQLISIPPFITFLTLSALKNGQIPNVSF